MNEPKPPSTTLVKAVRALSSIAFVPGLLAALYAGLGGVYLLLVATANLSRASFSETLLALVLSTLVIAAIVAGFWLHRNYRLEPKTNVWLYSFVYNALACVAMLYAIYEVIKRLSYLTFESWQRLYVIIPSGVALWTLSVAVLPFILWRSVKS
jgi:hypothetical protein